MTYMTQNEFYDPNWLIWLKMIYVAQNDGALELFGSTWVMTNCESPCLIVTHHDTLGLTMTYMILIPEAYEV